MKKKYVVFGTTYFAEMLSYYVETYDNAEVIGYTVDEKFRTSEEIFGKPLTDFEDLEEAYRKDEVSILLGIGYNHMNSLREKKFDEIKKKGFRIAEFIHPSASIEKSSMGEGNIILENVNIGYNVKIGNGNIFWNCSNISHHCEIGDFNFFAPSATLAGKINVKHHCFFGINCTVKGGIVINEYTLVGAGCYVNKSTEVDSVYVPEKSKRLVGKRGFDFL